MQQVSEVEVGGNPRVGRSMSTNPHLTSLCIPVHPIMSVSMYGQAFSRAKHGAKNCFDGPKNGPLQLNEGQSSINMPSPPAHPIMILISVMSIDFMVEQKNFPTIASCWIKPARLIVIWNLEETHF